MNKLMAILLASIFSVVSFNALADHTPEHTKANASVEATPEVVKGSPEKTEVKKHPLKEKKTHVKKEKNEKKEKVAKAKSGTELDKK